MCTCSNKWCGRIIPTLSFFIGPIYSYGSRSTIFVILWVDENPEGTLTDFGMDLPDVRCLFPHTMKKKWKHD